MTSNSLREVYAEVASSGGEGAPSDVVAMCLDATATAALAAQACADLCLSESAPGLQGCIRACLEVADLGLAVARLLARPRVAADAIGAAVEALVSALQRCSQECDEHADHHQHCAACARACRRAESAAGALLAAVAPPVRSL